MQTRSAILVFGVGILTVMGCDSAWEGLWLVEFGEGNNIAGDCVEYGDTGGPSNDYYENSTGDEFQIMEVEVDGGWVAVSFGHANLSLAGELDGTSINAERKSGYEYGYGEPGKHSSWQDKSSSKRTLTMDLEASEITGTMKSVYTETETSWRDDGTEEFTYSCTTKWKLDGSRGDQD
jgi:hypothetical protein